MSPAARSLTASGTDLPHWHDGHAAGLPDDPAERGRPQTPPPGGYFPAEAITVPPAALTGRAIAQVVAPSRSPPSPGHPLVPVPPRPVGDRSPEDVRLPLPPLRPGTRLGP